MRLFFHSFLVFFLLIICFRFFAQSASAEETGFRFPTTCETNGSSCENMRFQDNNYNSWPLTTHEEVVSTFTDFGIPEDAIIDDIQIKLRIKTSTFGWSWFPGWSNDSGTTYHAPKECRISPDSCHYNTGAYFNLINSYTMTWLNTTLSHTVTGKDINSPGFRLKLYQSTGLKTTDIDVLLFNVRYHFGLPTPTPTFTPTPTSALTPTPTPTPTPIPKTPLILIPGIGGSELKTTEMKVWSENDGHGGTFNYLYPKDETVWLNEPKARAFGDDDYFDVLRMKTDGTTSEANIRINGNLIARAYQGAIDFFISNGYELNKDFFVFPYDWRKDISLTASLLDQKINEIKSQTGSQKVDIVAHSMGGLVARNYISNASRAAKVRRLFTLGTPHLGSVDSIKNLRYGGCLTKPGVLTQLANNNICLGLVPSEVKDVIQNMISGYELAPSQEYFDFYNGQDKDHPYPYQNNGQSLNYSQIKSFLTNLSYNTSLFTPSELFHDLDNSLTNTNGVDIINIAGSGLPTLGQIIEKSVKDFFGNTVQKKDGFTINGDETVPLFSASLIDSSKNKSLLGNAKVFYTNQEHGNLVASGSALNLIKNILNNNNQLPTGVATQPYLFTGTEVSIYSPVNIHVYDSFENHTGPTSDGDFEANIPGSSYDTLDDAKFIFLPDDGNYTIRFEATDQGSFDFKIRKFENDTISEETLYKDIPLTTATKAETQFDTSLAQSPIIYLDEDGNGTVDRNINPSSNLTGDAVFDQTPPQTNIQISGILGNNGWYKSDVTISLIVQDEASGSGILKTEYSLDNGVTLNIYTEPFVISTEKINKLKFRSIDNAGNEENPKEAEIKIDKTPPQVTVDANPKTLWPANNKMVNVKITGTSSDVNLLNTKITVSDEYHKIEPSITNFIQTIQFQASRNGDDMDGRKYTIKAVAEDLAGNTAQALTEVIVPHDQRK